MWGHYGFSPMGYFGLGGFFNLIFWFFVIWAGVWFLRRGNWSGSCCSRGLNHNNNNNQTISLSDILKERYAKGEISKEEFEQKKKDLGL